ncbi:glycosyltransferase [Sphingobium olei]|uniref:Glycosyltransferase n=1 Tax=Sphingobium olei TaxID=420955 RepID=A0ABW3NV39_9SPHN
MHDHQKIANHRSAFRKFILRWTSGFAIPFDKLYYISRYPDVQEEEAERHFIRQGWRNGYSPNHNFDMLAYLAGEGIDIVKRHEDLNHRPFIRAMIDNVNIPQQARNFAQDYIDIVDFGLFDRAFYFEKYPDVVGDPIEHYLRWGWKKGYDPSPHFSTSAYLNFHPDVAKAEYNPLLHYCRFGSVERRLAARAVPSSPSEPEPILTEPHCPPLEDNRRRLQADIRQRLAPSTKKAFIAGPEISILVPVYNVPVIWLRQMVESVQHQTYDRWQLCIVDDCSTSAELRELLLELQAWDKRIQVVMREANGGISAASNDCLALATGEYVALLDNDDMLTNDALEEMARAIIHNDKPDWLYSDEFKIDEENNVSDLFAKPDWSPSMLFNYMYTGHLTLYKKSIVEAVGGFRSVYDFSQDYDLALRISEKDVRVVHVEKYLYAWRMIATSAASGGKPTARISNIAALQDAVDRRGWNGTATPLPTANRIVRHVSHDVKVSIVIPSDNERNIKASINSILENTTYVNYNIVVVTNSGIVSNLKPGFSSNKVNWANYDKPFNFSDKCNAGAMASDGEYVIFFNDDVRVITPDWIQGLLEYVTLPGVGAVGPKLLYENGLIQHGGMATGMRRLVGTAFHCYPDNSSVHFNFAQCVRDVSILCGALIAMPAKLFWDIGGFDAVNAPIGHSDVDLCFRVREAGFRCVYTPYAKLVHIGHVSIGEEEAVKKAFKRDKSEVFLLKRWCEYVARDPYFTPAMRSLTYMDSPENFQVFPGSGSAGKDDVLILSHDLTSSGAPKVAYDLALLMQSEGYFVTVVSPVDGPYRSKLVSHGITVIIDELILTGHESSMVLARSFDFVIANTIVCWQSVAELAKTTPTFLYSHETELVHHFADIYPDFLDAVRSATQIWSGSQHAADALAYYGLKPHIVEYGVDDITAAEGNPAIRIAVFGSIEPRKGQDLAILGMGDVAPEIRSKARLDLFGRTLAVGYHHQLEVMAAGIKQVHFGGELAYDEYRKALSDTDIILVCSRDDTLPLVSLDSLALGKALICSATTGTSRYLQHEESALILKHNSPQEIADAISRLIDDAELRQKIGVGARSVFEEYFTYDAFSKRIFKRFDEERQITVAS